MQVPTKPTTGTWRYYIKETHSTFCNFQYHFSQYGYYVYMFMHGLITFKCCAKNIFASWWKRLTDGWMDGQTDGQTQGQTD